jgi:enediyne biosynthesis protein E4
MLNHGSGNFTEVGPAYGFDNLRDGRGLAVSDFDGDGDLDFVVNNYNNDALYLVNKLPNRHWLRVRLRGTRCNRDGIGAEVRVRCGSLTMTRVVAAGDGYASQTSRVVHFGLGDHHRVDALEIRWPDGTSQQLKPKGVDQVLEVEQGS